jgi:hypothetical protein
VVGGDNAEVRTYMEAYRNQVTHKSQALAVAGHRTSADGGEPPEMAALLRGCSATPL